MSPVVHILLVVACLAAAAAAAGPSPVVRRTTCCVCWASSARRNRGALGRVRPRAHSWRTKLVMYAPHSLSLCHRPQSAVAIGWSPEESCTAETALSTAEVGDGRVGGDDQSVQASRPVSRSPEVGTMGQSWPITGRLGQARRWARTIACMYTCRYTQACMGAEERAGVQEGIFITKYTLVPQWCESTTAPRDPPPRLSHPSDKQKT